MSKARYFKSAYNAADELLTLLDDESQDIINKRLAEYFGLDWDIINE